MASKQIQEDLVEEIVHRYLDILKELQSISESVIRIRSRSSRNFAKRVYRKNTFNPDRPSREAVEL